MSDCINSKITAVYGCTMDLAKNDQVSRIEFVFERLVFLSRIQNTFCGHSKNNLMRLLFCVSKTIYKTDEQGNLNIITL